MCVHLHAKKKSCECVTQGKIADALLTHHKLILIHNMNMGSPHMRTGRKEEKIAYGETHYA
jgi:hypothetical protein